MSDITCQSAEVCPACGRSVAHVEDGQQGRRLLSCSICLGQRPQKASSASSHAATSHCRDSRLINSDRPGRSDPTWRRIVSVRAAAQRPRCHKIAVDPPPVTPIEPSVGNSSCWSTISDCSTRQNVLPVLPVMLSERSRCGSRGVRAQWPSVPRIDAIRQNITAAAGFWSPKQLRLFSRKCLNHAVSAGTTLE